MEKTRKVLGFIFMKKTHRILFGCIATCFCFFASMMAGSITELTAEVANLSEDIEEKNSDASEPANTASDTQTEENSFGSDILSIFGETAQAPTPLIIPTLSPTPSPSPSPTATPSPTPSPTATPSPTPSPTATPSPTPSPTPVPKTYLPDFTVSAITSNLNIRSGPGTSSKIIGKLSAECYVNIIEELDGWTKISTGTIKEGYVSTNYLFTPEEVKSFCDRDKLVSAKITASTLNVRSGPGTHYESIDKVKKGTTYTALLTKSYEGWIAIELKNGDVGYVAADYVKLSVDLDPGLTLSEIAEKEHQEAIKAAMARSQIFSVKETKRDPVSMTDEEIYLFATIVYTEAGNQKYEGQLAVANVILNRMEYGKWGDTLEEVIFAPGQFSGAKQEYIDRAQRKGIPDSCYKAVREALGGRNNIGDFRYFQTTTSAASKDAYLYYTKFIIIEDHVFYERNW